MRNISKWEDKNGKTPKKITTLTLSTTNTILSGLELEYAVFLNQHLRTELLRQLHMMTDSIFNKETCPIYPPPTKYIRWKYTVCM